MPDFQTTLAGSLPKPFWLAETDKLWPAWRSSGAELLKAKRDATLLWLKEQEDAGLDIVTDGEQSRQHFVHGFLEFVEGIDFSRKVKMGIRNNRYDAMVPVVTGPLKLKGRVHQAEASFSRQHTGKRLKLTLPGPMTIVDTIADEHYGDKVKLAMAFAALLNQEARALEKDGIDVIQFDEPAFNVYMDDVKRWGIDALHRAITMPAAEQEARLVKLRRTIREHDVHRWATSFLAAARGGTGRLREPEAILDEWTGWRAENLLVSLDYDGTLVPIRPLPGMAAPTPAIEALLAHIAALPGVTLALFALTGHHPVPAVLSLFLLGVTSQVLGLSLQTRLMDLSPAAPSLGAALCHSALNVGNANGAFLGGLVIAAGWGYLAPAWTGVVLSVAGLAIILLVGRRPAGVTTTTLPDVDTRPDDARSSADPSALAR